MAQITDLDYFTGLIFLSKSTQGTIAELNSYCLTYEEEGLLALLGRTLYTEYYEDSLLATHDAKWTNLIDGVATSFEYDGKTMIYGGLKTKFCYLIYSIYTRDQITSNTSFGDVSPKPSNGEQTYNTPRAVNAYNKWVDAFNDAVDYISYVNSITPDTYEGFDTIKLDYANSWGI
jgi:hypothetical protein